MSSGYRNGRLIYPVSVIGRTTDSSTSPDVDDLRQWQKEQQTVNPDDVIKGIAEIEKFLEGTPDSETLEEKLLALSKTWGNMLTNLTTVVNGKQNIITDLATIRKGAKLGETALQDHQDISGKLDKTEAATTYQPKGNYLTEHQDLSPLEEKTTDLLELLIITQTYEYETTETENPEWERVLVDSEDRILAGKRHDGTKVLMGKEIE